MRTNIIATWEIKKDPYLNKWIIWEVHPNYKLDIYHATTKKDCIKWIKTGELLVKHKNGQYIIYKEVK